MSPICISCTLITLLGYVLFLVTGTGHFFALCITFVACVAWYRGLTAGLAAALIVPSISGVLMLFSKIESSVVAMDVGGFLFISLLLGACVGSLSEMNRKLQDANRKVKKLEGLIPICASCKDIRIAEGTWEAVESYIKDNSDADFTHGLCPDCAKKFFPTHQNSDD